MKIKWTLLFSLLFVFTVNAQVVTWDPVYITPDDSVRVVFDATEGTGGLQGYTGTVYAHTGVITDASTGTSDWKYVVTDWGENTPETKLNNLGGDKWELVISPDIRSYYDVPATEEILQLAFVFRSAAPSGGSYLEGKDEGGTDIFIPLYLGVNILSPAQNQLFAELNDVINVRAVSSVDTDTMKLYIDDEFITETLEDTLKYDITVDEVDKKRVKIVASNSEGPFAADSFFYIVNPELTKAALPAGIRTGINYTSESSVILALFAPYKEYVYVIGDFNNWEADPEYFMNITPDDSTYWLEIDGLTPGTEYAFQYYIDGDLRIADPYTEKILDPWDDKYIGPETYPGLKPYPVGKTDQAVAILETGQEEFDWQVPDFVKPKKEDLVIYELLLRDFMEEHSYTGLIDTLDYLQNLGISAIELMPVNEFEGNVSWGYNPSFYFAPDKYYGTEDDLKTLIDECHKRGIAVILDMVLNHSFGQSPFVRLYNDGTYGAPTPQNFWFNRTARHPFNVGYDMNHESDYTKMLVDRVNAYWLTEYKIDGFRYDLSKGFTQKNSGDNVGMWGQYDQSRIDLLKRMADVVWSIDEDAYVILEHFADNSEEKVLANYGMMLWGNMNHNYNEGTMGYTENNKSSLDWASYKSRGWNDPNVVAYMESHDEERLMFKNLEYGNSSGDYNIKELDTALDRIKLASAFFFTIPGPKMIWEFGELGYDYSINWPSGTEDDRLTPKPARWDYLEDTQRYYLYRTMSEIIKLKKQYGVFETEDFNMSVSGGMKRINLNSDSMNVTIIGNFNVDGGNVNPSFQSTGTWYDYFADESLEVNDVNANIYLEPGEWHIYTSLDIPSPEDGPVLDIEDDIAGEVTDYSLKQNYPNPFNPSTQIVYTIPENAFVTVKVYNSVGQEIKTLVSRNHTKGAYEVTWNGNNMAGTEVASGIYFYRIEAGNFTSVKKMILLR